MPHARRLIGEFLSCLERIDSSVDACVDLFAEDGVFEFPYFPSLGMPWRFEGKSGIRDVLETIRSFFPAFTVSDVVIDEVADGDGLFVQYHARTVLRDTGRPYAQHYVSRLVAENGRIKLLREYLDVIAAARALLPNGLADLPPPHGAK